MAENDEAFVPHSDEDLAKLLEEQMRELRAQTGAQPTLPPQDAPIARDPELDQIFSALLEGDEPDVEVAKVVVTETIVDEFKSVIDSDSLTQTEPLTIIREEVTAIVVTDPVVDTVDESAPPIPPMFAEQVTEADYIAAVMEPEIHVVTVAETVVDTVTEDGSLDEIVIDEISVDGVLVEETISETITEVVEDEVVEVVAFNATNPITNFERRPSFDELVFGAGTSD